MSNFLSSSSYLHNSSTFGLSFKVSQHDDSHIVGRGRSWCRGGRRMRLLLLRLFCPVAAAAAAGDGAVLEDGRLQSPLPDLLSVAQLRDPRLLKYLRVKLKYTAAMRIFVNGFLTVGAE